MVVLDQNCRILAFSIVQGGVGIYEVQKLGRWKSITMVQRDAHHYPESLRSAIAVMDNSRGSIYHNRQKKRVTNHFYGL